MGWEEVADELYGLPPEQFVAARDRAARAASREDAARIRALRRPTLAAWAVNLLVRSDREEITALVRLGEDLRRAHGDLDGRQLRALVHQQHQLVAALSRQAQRLAAQTGHAVGDSVLREVEATVQSALADPEAAGELTTGRLTKTFPPPAGFGPPVTGRVLHLHRAQAASGRPARRGATGSGRRGVSRPGRAAAGERPASVTDLTKHNEERVRQERERREQISSAGQGARDLQRVARARAKDADDAERAVASARERLRAAERRVEECERNLRQAKAALAAAREAERAARAPARQARRAADRAREEAERAAGRLERLQNGG